VPSYGSALNLSLEVTASWLGQKSVGQLSLVALVFRICKFKVLLYPCTGSGCNELIQIALRRNCLIIQKRWLLHCSMHLSRCKLVMVTGHFLDRSLVTGRVTVSRMGSFCYHHNLTRPEGGPRARWAQRIIVTGLRIGPCAGVLRPGLAMYLDRCCVRLS
jgi:hypothetical protein